VSRALRFSVCAIVFTQFLSAHFSGAIQGTVADATQASVPDAVVTSTNLETGITPVAKTSNEGFYRISNLAPGALFTASEAQHAKETARQGGVGSCPLYVGYPVDAAA